MYIKTRYVNKSIEKSQTLKLDSDLQTRILDKEETIFLFEAFFELDGKTVNSFAKGSCPEDAANEARMLCEKKLEMLQQYN